MLLAATAGHADGEVFNVGSGQQWSNEDLVDRVQRLTDRNVRVRVGDYPAKTADTGYWVADIRKAAAVLGWRPRHDLARGLQKTIEWFRAHQDAHDRVTAARG
jgi:nucleoside-diphosphate-sugar epimerase